MLKKLTLGYCPVGNGDAIGPFSDVFEKKKPIGGYGDIFDGKEVDGCDAVVFWGGQDIHPSIYGQRRHPTSQAGHTLSSRDVFELAAMTYCRMKGIPMIGVCRGAQLMCAFEGGSLVQHCNNHAGADHKIRVEVFPNKHEVVWTTSAHHQMMNPAGSRHVVLGETYEPSWRASYYDGESSKDQIEGMDKLPEPEIVYFPGCKGLAIQGHPEWVDATDPFAQVCNLLIRQRLLSLDPVLQPAEMS